MYTGATLCRDVNTLTADDIKRLPWFFTLEISPMALGDTPYGMPYSGKKVNPKDTQVRTFLGAI